MPARLKLFGARQAAAIVNSQAYHLLSVLILWLQFVVFVTCWYTSTLTSPCELKTIFIAQLLRGATSSQKHPTFSEQTRRLSLVTSLIMSQLDYGSAVLVGVSRHLLDRLQSVLHAAARLVCEHASTSTTAPLYCFETSTGCGSQNPSSTDCP